MYHVSWRWSGGELISGRSQPTYNINTSITCYSFTENIGVILNLVSGFIHFREIFVISDNDIGSFKFGGDNITTSSVESFTNSGSDIMYMSIKILSIQVDH